MRRWIWLFSIFAYIFVTLVLVRGKHDIPAAYVAYFLSAVALVCDIGIILPVVMKRMRTGMLQTKFGARLLTDFEFKEKFFLLMSFGINAVYAFMNLVNGIAGKSAWAITFAAYYLVIGILRLTLFTSLNMNGYGLAVGREYKLYYRCGFIIILMGIPFGGIVTLMIRNKMSYHYSQMMIYIMASYVFYSLIGCIVNIIRYKKFRSPVLSAVKRISFISALISLIGLQTAMLERFQAEETYRIQMVYKTGIGILLIILVIGIEMVLRGRKGMQRTRS